MLIFKNYASTIKSDNKEVAQLIEIVAYGSKERAIYQKIHLTSRGVLAPRMRTLDMSECPLIDMAHVRVCKVTFNIGQLYKIHPICNLVSSSVEKDVLPHGLSWAS